MRRILKVGLIILFVFSLAGTSYATNGMNMISYGGQESGMAGASLGVSDNAVSMNNNPAGLTQIKNGEIDLGISLLMPRLKHEDNASTSGPNETRGVSKIFPLPVLAYANKIGDGPVAIGLGVFAQGGMGAEYRNLNTAFGTKDKTFSNVRYVKVTPTVAYQFSENLSAGVALNFGYSDVEMEFFPDTDFPGVFLGMDLEDEYAFGYGAKVGILYRVSKAINIGTVYTTRAELEYDHGTLEFADDTKYDASLEGFTWPASWGVGIGIRPSDKILIATDVTWVFWNDAMNTVKIKTSSNEPGKDSVAFKMDWKDQIVFAVGAAYKASESFTVRLGYNYGKNPVPKETLSPLFPAITEHHATIGVGYQASKSIVINGAWEHAFNKKVEYTNNEAPFGPDAVEQHGQNTFHLFVTYVF